MRLAFFLLGLIALRAWGHDSCSPTIVDGLHQRLQDMLAPIQNLLLPQLDITPMNWPMNPSTQQLCRRDPELVDTIVIHHTATAPNTPLELINRNEWNMGTRADPGAMVAYHYLVQAPYESEAGEPAEWSQSIDSHVTQGRSFDLVGAHAGAQSYVPLPRSTQEEALRRLKDPGSILCGKPQQNDEGQVSLMDPVRPEDVKLKNLRRNRLDAQGRAFTNFTSIGIAVVGYYAYDPKGELAGTDRNPKHWRKPSKETYRLLARLVCQIQREHPNVKRMLLHKSVRGPEGTLCPGSISVEEIKTVINTSYRWAGCSFE